MFQLFRFHFSSNHPFEMVVFDLPFSSFVPKYINKIKDFTSREKKNIANNNKIFQQIRCKKKNSNVLIYFSLFNLSSLIRTDCSMTNKINNKLASCSVFTNKKKEFDRVRQLLENNRKSINSNEFSRGFSQKKIFVFFLRKFRHLVKDKTNANRNEILHKWHTHTLLTLNFSIYFVKDFSIADTATSLVFCYFDINKKTTLLFSIGLISQTCVFFSIEETREREEKEGKKTFFYYQRTNRDFYRKKTQEKNLL
eukprot:284814762_5